MTSARYRETLERLFALRRRGMVFELSRVEQALAELGNPHHRLRVVHVAGTNGKGSTAAMIEAGLRAAGLKTGLFTSPHLARFTERFRVSGCEIEPERVVELAAPAERADRASGEGLTFFEIATVMAFRHFAAEAVDVAVMEVGLGGRLDATNVAPAPIVSVVTRVGLDHQALLGETLAEIAREKAGIFKQGVPAVVAEPNDAEVRAVFTAEAKRRSASLRFQATDPSLLRGRSLALAGEHQHENACLALAALGVAKERGLPLGDDAFRAAVERVAWPGRMETVGQPPVLLDCAHNPQAAAALARHLAATGRRYNIVLGVLADKDGRGILAALREVAQRLWLVAPPSGRALDPQRLAEHAPGAVVVASIEQALGAAHAAGGPVLVTGSIALVGYVRALVRGEARDPLDLTDPAAPISAVPLSLGSA